MSHKFDEHRIDPTAEAVEMENVRRALRRASTLEAVKAIWDTAEGQRRKAKRAGMSLDVQNFLMEMRLRAERRGGELLAEMTPGRGRRPTTSTEGIGSLASLDINRNQSSGWQRLAAIPETIFEGHLQAVKDRGEALSIKRVVELANHFRDPRHRKRRPSARRSSNSLPRIPPAGASTSTPLAAELENLKDHLEQAERILRRSKSRTSEEFEPLTARYLRQLVGEMRSIVHRITRC